MEKKPECQLCGHKILDGVEVTICRICSLETCVCQHCGTAIESDDEKLEKKKRKKGKRDGKQQSENNLRDASKRHDLKDGNIGNSNESVSSDTDKLSQEGIGRTSVQDRGSNSSARKVAPQSPSALPNKQ